MISETHIFFRPYIFCFFLFVAWQFLVIFIVCERTNKTSCVYCNTVKVIWYHKHIFCFDRCIWRMIYTCFYIANKLEWFIGEISASTSREFFFGRDSLPFSGLVALEKTVQRTLKKIDFYFLLNWMEIQIYFYEYMVLI